MANAPLLILYSIRQIGNSNHHFKPFYHFCFVATKAATMLHLLIFHLLQHIMHLCLYIMRTI